MNICWN